MADRQFEILENEGFTVVYNDLIQDGRLRLQTRAVLILMLSKPKNWDFSVRGMAAIAGVTKDTMARMLNELIEAGYVQRKAQAREGGRFGRGGFIVSGRAQFAAPGPGEAGTAAGAAARAGEFISPSEYEMDGVPDTNQRSVCGGARPSEAGPAAEQISQFPGHAPGNCTLRGQSPTGGSASSASDKGGVIPTYGKMDGVPAKLERSELSGARPSEAGNQTDVEDRRSLVPVGAADPCPDFSYAKPSYAKKSPQQNKEQVSTEQEEKDPPKSPLRPEERVRERQFDPQLESAVLSWLQYKRERGEMYKPTGLQALLSRIAGKAAAFGTAAVVDVIEQSMSANWQGIVWDKLGKNSAPAQGPVRRFLE